MSYAAAGTPGNAPLPPNQATTAQQKPTLTGVRIRQRKGQAKAASKFEPETFRDALLLHLALLPTPLTTDALVAKLVSAGSTLEFLKYYEQLFELLFVGGLLQPGGSYLDEKRSPVYILKTDGDITLGAGESGGEDGWKDSVKGVVETLKRVIQRYKYLQKPLEENFLPDLLGYLHKWDPAQRAKLAEATALLVLDLQISPRCLTSLTKEHVVKDDVALDFFTVFVRQYLAKQNVETLGSALRRSGLKDILLVFPFQVRKRKNLEEHFRKENLPQINEWYAKLALGEAKDETVLNIERMINEEDSNEVIIEHLKTQKTDNGVTDAQITEWIWQALMKTVDWTARADQIDQSVVQHIQASFIFLVQSHNSSPAQAHAPIIEAFCNGAKAEVGLINAVQVYCYTDTRIIKSFQSILKVLYNTDCVSGQAIIYWHQKGAKAQGTGHFVKATEGLVAFLEHEESDEE